MIQMPIPPLVSVWSESNQYLRLIRKKTKTHETRNSENKMLNVLPLSEIGMEVQGSSYLLLLPCYWGSTHWMVSEGYQTHFVQWLVVLVQQKYVKGI